MALKRHRSRMLPAPCPVRTRLFVVAVSSLQHLTWDGASPVRGAWLNHPTKSAIVIDDTRHFALN